MFHQVDQSKISFPSFMPHYYAISENASCLAASLKIQNIALTPQKMHFLFSTTVLLDNSFQHFVNPTTSTLSFSSGFLAWKPHKIRSKSTSDCINLCNILHKLVGQLCVITARFRVMLSNRSMRQSIHKFLVQIYAMDHTNLCNHWPILIGFWMVSTSGKPLRREKVLLVGLTICRSEL